MVKPLIFISYTHEEQSLAELLQHEFGDLFLNAVDFFVSSDRRTLRGGDDWLREIKDALSRASVVLALVSPRSVDKTWINFESGAGWLHGRVVPLCHSGLKPVQLPQPLQSLIGFDLHESNDLRDLAELVGRLAGLKTPTADWPSTAEKISSVIAALGPTRLSPYGAMASWVFSRSADVTTIAAMAQCLSRASTLRIYSIGSNFLWMSNHLDLLETRVASGTLSARICMADFTSEHIQRRIAEEPNHPIGVPGSEHLVRQLVRCEKRVADQTRLAVRVFQHYPTYAVLAFDDEIYVYPYGYQTLGNYSPTFYWQGRDPAIQFFMEQFEHVWNDARPASAVYE